MLQKPDPGISATPHENNLRYFNVVIAGPQDSAYDGSSCLLDFSFLPTPCQRVLFGACALLVRA
jgi:ubiquitin-conjugating enzyme E2 N